MMFLLLYIQIHSDRTKTGQWLFVLVESPKSGLKNQMKAIEFGFECMNRSPKYQLVRYLRDFFQDVPGSHRTFKTPETTILSLFPIMYHGEAGRFWNFFIHEPIIHFIQNVILSNASSVTHLRRWTAFCNSKLSRVSFSRDQPSSSTNIILELRLTWMSVNSRSSTNSDTQLHHRSSWHPTLLPPQALKPSSLLHSRLNPRHLNLYRAILWKLCKGKFPHLFLFSKVQNSAHQDRRDGWTNVSNP